MSEFKFKTGNENKIEIASEFEKMIKDNNIVFAEIGALTADESYKLRQICTLSNIHVKSIKNTIASKVLTKLSYPDIKLENNILLFIGQDVFVLNKLLSSFIKDKKIIFKFIMNSNSKLSWVSSFSSQKSVYIAFVKALKNPICKLTRLLKILTLR